VASRQHIVKRDDEHLIAFLIADIYECAGRLRREGEAIAAGEGQTQARWQLLSVCSDRSLTVPQAARRLGVSRQAVQRVANDLDQDTLLQFSFNPDHRSSPLLSITPLGRTVLANISQAATRFNRNLVAGLGPQDIETTRRVLRTLVERLP
jgi:DNA-binding MarR family transcriptional regulator